MVWDDINQSDTDCPKCGKLLVWRYCQELGCDGGIISSDYDCDPGWLTSGDFYCSECKGTGIEKWCQNCGYGIA